MCDEAPSTPSKGYFHACQRAELLGLKKLTEAEWLASDERAFDRDAEEQNACDDAQAQELSENDESIRHITGGLDELNTILTATQKKINKFKTVCGSLGTLLKARVASQSGSSSKHSQSPTDKQQQQQVLESANVTAIEEDVEVAADREYDDKQRLATTRKVDLNSKVGSHLDKLDSLITKAENAQYSIKQQTSQMKQFFK